MILLLTIGTAIPQTRPSPYYDIDKEYHPEKNVREKCTILYTVYGSIVPRFATRDHCYQTVVT